jgi:hypothetical protein
MRYNGYKLIIRVNFMVKYVCDGFRFNGLVTKTQPFPMDCHYRMNIISGVAYSRSDSLVLLVLCTIAMQWLGHCHYTTGLSRRRQPY